MPRRQNFRAGGDDTPSFDPSASVFAQRFKDIQLDEKRSVEERKAQEAKFSALVAATNEADAKKDDDKVIYKIQVTAEKCASPLSLKRSDGSGFNGYAAIQVGESLTRSGFKNAATADPWVVVAKQDYSGAWVADDVKYQEILMLDSINPKLSKSADGKKVYAYGPSGTTLPMVRRSAYERYQRGGDKDTAITDLETVLASLEKMIKIASGSVEDKHRIMQQWMTQNPEQSKALREALRVLDSNVGAQTLFKQSTTHSCSTYHDDNTTWSKDMGTPTQTPQVRPDNPVYAEEKKHKKWLRGIPLLDANKQPYCASPSSKDRYGNSPFDHYGEIYHGLTDVVNTKTKLQDTRGQDMADQEAYVNLGFCAQRETKKFCESGTPATLPLSEKKKAPAELCTYNEEEEQCAPKGLKKGTDLYELYHQPGGFADTELDIVKRRQQLRRNLDGHGKSREERRAARKQLGEQRKMTHRRFGNAPVENRYARIGAEGV